MSLKDNLKSIYVNKFALTGYALLGSASAMIPYINQPSTNSTDSNLFMLDCALFSIGALCFIGTSGGYYTRKTYEKVKTIIKTDEKKAIQWYNRADLTYCNDKGALLAFKESDLLEKLNKKSSPDFQE